MLTHLSVGHYKSLADIDITFARSNIIVGPNGSGKSNLIDCLNFVRDAALEDLDSATTRRHGADSVRQWSRSRPYDVHISMNFKSARGSGRYSFILASSKGQFKVKEESGLWISSDDERLEDGRHRIANFQRNSSGRVRVQTNMGRHSERPISINPYELLLSQLSQFNILFPSAWFRWLVREITQLSTYAIYPNTMRVPQVVSREDVLVNDGGNLASVIKRLNSSGRTRKTRLLEALKAILPIIDNIEVRSAGGFYVPILRVSEGGSDVHDLNMSQVSDGTLRMLGLLSAFYQPRAPTKIALEEPEQMIHPGILPVLKDAADDYLSMDDENQYFITTHSPNFLNLFEPEDIVWTKFEKGVSIARKTNSKRLDLIHSELMSPGEMLVKQGASI